MSKLESTPVRSEADASSIAASRRPVSLVMSLSFDWTAVSVCTTPCRPSENHTMPIQQPEASRPEDLRAYPRPQLQRAAWTSLDGEWRFRFDNEKAFGHPSEITEWPLRIRVPFPVESQASGIGDRGFHQACWYQREFDAIADGGRILLHFGAVDYRAKVWINGMHVLNHEGGHTPFAIDVTHALEPSGRQVLTVYVEDDPHELTKPRG
ncbi:MAG: sugar-binding domain-containing protein [Luteimonas sp.]